MSDFIEKERERAITRGLSKGGGMTSDEQLTFALAQTELWRMKYLKAQEELKKAVEAEREACAKIVEEGIRQEWIVRIIAKSIRARGQE